MTRRNVTETHLYCPECGNISTIFRKSGRQRQFGHLKKLYCWHCKEEINHIELKNYEMSYIKEGVVT